MPEIDLRRNKWLQGYPREEQLVARELYALLSIFAASATLSERRKNDADVYTWSIGSFEYAEIGRILVTLAAMLRNDWDAAPYRVEQNLTLAQKGGSVGELIPDLRLPSQVVELSLRESLHKILHAYTINLERSEGRTITSGHLLPRVHLYGEHRDKEWKATMDVYAWAEAVHGMG